MGKVDKNQVMTLWLSAEAGADGFVGVLLESIDFYTFKNPRGLHINSVAMIIWLFMDLEGISKTPLSRIWRVRLKIETIV